MNREYNVLPKYEVIGPAFCSLVFYLMYTAMVLIMYSGKNALYILMFFTTIVSLISLMGSITQCNKYYSPYTILNYKKNTFVFSLEIISLIVNSCIYNLVSLDNNSKCEITLQIELIFIAIIGVIYIREYDLLNAIDERKKEKLLETYCIKCAPEESKDIEEAKTINNNTLLKYIILNCCIFTAITKSEFYYIPILYVIIAHIGFFKKCKNVFEVVYKNDKNKAFILNLLSNVITALGFILNVLIVNDILSVGLFKTFFTDYTYYAVIYIPFQIISLKINGLYNRVNYKR